MNGNVLDVGGGRSLVSSAVHVRDGADLSPCNSFSAVPFYPTLSSHHN